MTAHSTPRPPAQPASTEYDPKRFALSMSPTANNHCSAATPAEHATPPHPTAPTGGKAQTACATAAPATSNCCSPKTITTTAASTAPAGPAESSPANTPACSAEPNAKTSKPHSRPTRRRRPQRHHRHPHPRNGHRHRRPLGRDAHRRAAQPANYIQRSAELPRHRQRPRRHLRPRRHPRPYYLSQPDAMINGEVRAPNCYLDALETLKRQYHAYLFDRVADFTIGGEGITEIPATSSTEASNRRHPAPHHRRIDHRPSPHRHLP